MKLISGTSNPKLAERVARRVGERLADVEIKRFKDGEIFAEIKENMRGEHAFVIQSTSHPANDHLMELLILVETLRRASAKSVSVVIPYFGYARQDRKTSSRTPITAKLVANMIETAGADRVLTMDLHAGQIQGFFDIPVDNLFAAKLFEEDVRRRYGDGNPPTLVSPDVGGVKTARYMAERLGAGLAIIDKRRERANEAEAMHIIGDVSGSHCLVVDDIVDTAGTMMSGVEALLDAGAKSVSAYATHGVLSPPALERISNARIDEVVVTDTIAPRPDVSDHEKVRVLDTSSLFARAMDAIYTERSISGLFKDDGL